MTGFAAQSEEKAVRPARIEMGASHSQSSFETSELAPEDQHRAALYHLLGALFFESPSHQLLDEIGQLTGGDGHFPTAIGELGTAARSCSQVEVANEFERLFTGTPVAQLMPYASHYQGGRLFGRPLAELRMEMARRGIARNENATEPEDHVAPVCEMMAGLILGKFGEPPLPLGQQKQFFDAHISPWMGNFFADLTAARDASLYRHVGNVGKLFIELEKTSLSMVSVED